MAFIVSSKVKSTANVVKHPLNKPTEIRIPYQIPDKYRNSFYLANSSLFDSINWFLHRAYEVLFPSLIKKLRLIDSNRLLSDNEIAEKIENIVQVLDQCNSVIDVRFPIRRDNGQLEVIRGFRAHHGLFTGYKGSLGGLRMDVNITRDHMKAFSVLSTYRNACLGIGMTGAFGGLKICPQNYSPFELQQILKTFALNLGQKGYCNNRDVFLPDMNCGEKEMNWINESCVKLTGRNFDVAAVGKNVELGGIPNYYEASPQGTFLGVEFFLNNEELMKKVGLSTGLKGKTFIIQGMGKLGKPLAELLLSNRAICVGVKDYDAYIYDANGINFQELCEYKAKTGSIINYETTKPYQNDAIFSENCDILILAAFQKTLICYTADKVKAKVIVEAGDGSITPSAHRILTDRSKLVLPDLYVCTGGTIAAFLEYIANILQIHGIYDSSLKMSKKIYEDAVDNFIGKQQILTAGKNSSVWSSSMDGKSALWNTLQMCITEIGKEILSINTSYNLGTDIRTATYIIAINNILDVVFSGKNFVLK